MLKYMRADLHRIYRRLSRYVLLVVFYIAELGGLAYTITSKHQNSIGIISDIGFMYMALAVVLGLAELLMVFSDDFKAKTMQIAIGGGISRAHVVLAKLIEYALLVVGDLLLLALGIIACSAATGNPLQGPQMYQVLIYVFGYLMSIVIPAAITMIVMFYMQSVGLAVILYLIFFADPLSFVMSMFGTNEIVLRLHLNELPYSSMVNTVNTQLGLQAAFPAAQIVGLFVYLVAAYVLTVAAFNKRELEF